MLKVWFVGDGPRDHCTVPHLVATFLGVRVEADAHAWSRLHKIAGSGYQRQFRYAVRQAIDAEAHGLLATLDRDKAPNRERLKELQSAREEERNTGRILPIAFGEAVPHGEAWLLDDPVAVRRGLGLESNCPVPNIRHTKDPKATLEDLRDRAPKSDAAMIDLLHAVACEVDPKRCVHEKETGFKFFREDVCREFGPLANGCGDGCDRMVPQEEDLAADSTEEQE